jgi:hypothetical protein
MFLKRVAGRRQVTLPDGTILSRADLPPRDTQRWIARRKAVVVRAVRHGLLTEAEVLERYGLSAEEFAFWQDGEALHGEAGLRVTKLKRYRQPSAHTRQV